MQYLRNNRLQLAAIGLIVLATFIPISLLQVCLLIAGFFFANSLARRIVYAAAPTKCLSLVIAVPMYMFTLQLVAFAVWLISPNTPLSIMPGIATLLLAIPHLLIRQTSKPTPRKWFSKYDILSVVFAFIAVVAVSIQLLVRFPGLPNYSIVGLVDGNVDDGTHIALLNDRLDYNRGFLKRSTYEHLARVDPTFNAYPLGWHIANATVAHTITNGQFSPLATLYFYAITKLVWFFWVVLLFFRFTYLIYERQGAEKRGGLILLTCLAILFGAYILIDQYRLGFYSFFPQLMSIILLAYALLHLKETKDVRELVHISVAIVIFAISGGLSWLLLLPVMVLGGIVPLFLQWYRLGKNRLIAGARVMTAYLPLVCIAALAVLSQLGLLYASRHDGAKSFIDAINTYGNIAVYGQAMIAVIIVGVFLYLRAQHKDSHRSSTATLFFIGLLAAFTAIIYFIQMFSVEHTSYYFYKTLDSLLYLIVPFALVGIVWATTTYTKEDALHRISIPIIVLSLIILYVGFPAGNSPTVSYVSGKLGLDSGTAQLVYSEIAYSQTKPGFTFVYLQGKPFETDVANVLMKSRPLYTDCYKALRPSFNDGTLPEEIVKIAKRVCDDIPLRIYTKNTSDLLRFSNSATLYNAPNIHTFLVL